MENKSIKLTKAISELDILLNNFDVTIKLGDDPQLQYSAQEDDIPLINMDASKLVIKSPKHSFNLFKFLTFHKTWCNNKLSIILPKNTHLKKAKFRLDTGDLDATDLTAEQIDLFSDTGDVDFDHLNADKVDSKCDTGDMRLQDSHLKALISSMDTGDFKGSHLKLSKLTCTNDTGDVELAHVTTKSLTTSVDTGDVNLSYVKTDDFSHHLDTGDLSINHSNIPDEAKN